MFYHLNYTIVCCVCQFHHIRIFCISLLLCNTPKGFYRTLMAFRVLTFTNGCTPRCKFFTVFIYADRTRTCNSVLTIRCFTTIKLQAFANSKSCCNRRHGNLVVYVEGFEPPTLCSQSRCPTKLGYT